MTSGLTVKIGLALFVLILIGGGAWLINQNGEGRESGK